ncbi:MAG TPA: phosphoheptose isomerase [Sutterella sp.]|nr:phosphoheptose isomerase [Sutterella sp.]
MSVEHVKYALNEAQEGLTRLLANEAMLEKISEAGHLLATSLASGGHVYSCGNGGSLCDAMHFAEELTGRFRKNRQPLAAQAISDASHMSCVSNDFGYESVFSRYVEAFGRKGDVLVAISTSGKSHNVLLAAQAAKRLGMSVIVLTGRDGTELTETADIAIVTPAGRFADRVQELHIKCVHIMIELVERELAPENYAD